MACKAVAALALVAGTASAFVAHAPLRGVVRAAASGPVMKLGPGGEGLIGSDLELAAWDPLGFTNNANPETIAWYRAAELKHGRVAMLAALGMVVQEGFHPFFGTAGQDIGPAAFHLQKVEVNFPLLPLTLLAGVAATEAFTIGKGWSKTSYKEDGLGAGFVANLKEDYFPGDLGFDPLGLYPASPEAKADIRNKELNNGRLAMIAIWGMWAQELVDGNTLGEHFALYGFGPAN